MSSLTQLKNYKIHPKKKLGQNFLVDEKILEEIIDLYDLKKDEVVVEIGAGLGALTTRLAPRVRKVLAIEIDKALADILKDKIIKDKNVEVITQDVLLFNFPKVAKLYGGKLKVLGNIPYGISAPLLFKLLECKNSLSMAILMFQKEVADRIVANPGTKDYGALSVFSQISAAVSKELLISRCSFYPQPKVDSAVVRFVFSESFIMGIKDEQIFKSVVRASFAQRRKTLKNTLKNTLNLGMLFSDVLNAVKVCGIDPVRRGETLNLEEFKDLANCLAELRTH
ncbi:MAG: ribosomal RNA small subunit methyltransferase A [Desulfobacterales bacterium]|nr:ribosomal RNA small subunit methyltransferase A [Desulfobacterales bacterium]